MSFWYKGDVRFVMPGVDNATIHLTGEYEWKKHTRTVTTQAGITALSLYFYDLDHEDGLPLLIDNVVLSVVPEPATMSLLVIGGLASLRRKRRNVV